MLGANAAWMNNIAPSAAERARACEAAGAAVERAESQAARWGGRACCDAAGQTEGLVAAVARD